MKFLILCVCFAMINGVNINSKYISYRFGECIGAGFKNIILKLIDRNDLIVRIGLIHQGTSVLSFRNDSEIMKFASAVKEWKEKSEEGTFLDDILSQHLKCQIKNKDIVPRRDIENEVLFERLSQTRSQLVFQVSGTLHRVEVPLPATSHIPANITAVVEYNLMMDGDINGLNSSHLTEQDMLVILLGVFNDQLTFKKSTGAFHFDGHPGNILYQRGNSSELFFVWSDFGKTSSSSSNANQFRNSMVAVYNYLLYRSKHLPSFLHILDDLIKVSDNFDETFLMSDNGLLLMLKSIEKRITELYKQKSVENLLIQMSPTSRFGIQYLSEKISLLEDRVIHLERTVEVQANQIAEQANQIAEQAKQIANLIILVKSQSLQIESQSLQISELKTKVLQLENNRTCNNDL